MYKEQRHLLCTFADSKNYKEKISKILNFYNVQNNKVFVFVNKNKSTEVYLTYNVFDYHNVNNKMSDTILIHRKKQTNSLYTLNALNKLVQEENDGNLDKKFEIQWDLYKNSLILTNEVSVRIISIELMDLTKERE